ncbi:MAG TPA: hypothetical protein VIU40_06310 [Geobacteraceae bacterium]
MSVVKKVIIPSATLVALAMPVLAAVDEREPAGNLAVWVFLGFCALIIVAQLFPLVAQAWRKQPGQDAKKAEITEESPGH